MILREQNSKELKKYTKSGLANVYIASKDDPTILMLMDIESFIYENDQELYGVELTYHDKTRPYPLNTSIYPIDEYRFFIQN